LSGPARQPNASRPGVSEPPGGGGRAKIENSSRRHPPEIWSETISGSEEGPGGEVGWPVFGLPPSGKIYRQQRRGTTFTDGLLLGQGGAHGTGPRNQPQADVIWSPREGWAAPAPFRTVQVFGVQPLWSPRLREENMTFTGKFLGIAMLS